MSENNDNQQTLAGTFVNASTNEQWPFEASPQSIAQVVRKRDCLHLVSRYGVQVPSSAP